MRLGPVVAGVIITMAWTARSAGAEGQAVDSPIVAEIAAIETRVARGEIKDAVAEAAALLARTESEFGPDAPETGSALLVHVRLQLVDSTAPRPDLKPLAERALRIAEATRGPEDAKVASALDKLAHIAKRAADFPTARSYFERAIAIDVKALGPEHENTLMAKTGLATVLRDLGQFDEARKILEEVLAAYERTGTGKPASRVSLYINLGLALYKLGDPPKARETWEQGLALARASFTEQTELVGKLLLNLGSALAEELDFAGAAAHVQEALAIFEKNEGPDGPNVAAALESLGMFLEKAGDSVGALPYMRRALAGFEKNFGPDHPETLNIRMSLATALISLGQTEEARPLLESARSALSAKFGSDNPQLLGALALSSRLELAEGNYEAAREFAEREIVFSEQISGPDHPQGLDEAAAVYLELGNLAEARKLIERMILLMTEAGGPEDPHLSKPYRRLAALERQAGNLAAAQRAIDRAIEIERKVPPAGSSPQLPPLITERARILAARGKLRQAVEERRKGLAMSDRLLGQPHPFSAMARLHLADLLGRTGRPGEARPLFEQGLATLASLYGEGSLFVATQRNPFAEFEALHGDRSSALRIALGDAATLRDNVRGTTRYLTEREALAFEDARDSGLDVALWALAGAKASSSSAGEVWDEVIRSRALILDEMATRHRLSSRGGDPELTALVRRATAARERLARLAAAPSEPLDAKRFRARWDHAVDDRDQIEREIARRTAAHDKVDRAEQPGWRAVGARLEPGDAVVAYVQYEELPSPLSGPGTEAYLAFILGPAAQSPQVVSIGPAGTVDPLVANWREWIVKVPPPIGGPNRSEQEGRTLDAGRALRKRVWDPVAAKLGGAHRVFVVPDGALNLVNLAALPADAGGYLVESGPLFHLLSSERDLLVPRRRSPSRGGLLAVGGVNFDSEPHPGDAAETAAVAAHPGKPAPFRGAAPSCPELRSLRFDPLPGSEIEAGTVSSLWQAAEPKGGVGPALLLNGRAADEGSFKDLAPGHRVIHVATHGFFADPQCADRASSEDTLGDQPLLQSGLAFAGSNRRAESRREDVDDGMLTAEEIGSLDLDGTEWVVLSSCGSGMGRVVAGEGVLGLRRAFEVAGAGTLVTTLWSVNDAATLDWVRELYRARLDGASTAEAVRRASLKVISARRADGLSVVPYYWGAFVASGDWR